MEFTHRVEGLGAIPHDHFDSVEQQRADASDESRDEACRDD